MCCNLVVVAASELGGFKQARDLYYQGIYGDKGAGSRADTLFTNLHEQNPNEPLVTVYFGSMRLLEAEHTWALWKKNSLSKQGIQLMDAAVAAAPQNLEVRFVRGATERELPGFFGRKQQAKDDIRTIVKSPAFKQPLSFEPRLVAASLYYYALDCLDAGNRTEALNALRRSVEAAPDSHAGRLAAEKLKALP